MDTRSIAGMAALAAASLLAGCAVYPAHPGYTAYPSAPVVQPGAPVAVEPAPVVVVPAPVYAAPPPPAYYYGPRVYPSISLGIFGRFGGHRHHHHGHRSHHRGHGHRHR